jgi:gas vesicle protein
MTEATTPIEAAFEVQRQTIEHGQQLFEQTLDAQQRGAETILRNVFAAQRSAQQQGLDVTRQLVDAQADAFGSVVDEGFQATVDQQLAEVSELQDDALDQFEAELLDAIEDLTDQQREFVAQSVRAVLQAHDEVERGTVEGVQQAQAATESVQETAEGVTQDVQETAEGVTQDVQETAEGVTQDVQETAEGVTQDVQDAAEGVARDVQDAAEEAPDATGQQTVTTAEIAVEQLEDIDGLGSTYADRLRDAGIVSPTHLVEANLETIVEAADVREDQAEQWIELARAA